MKNNKNILIGHNAGIDFTTETNRLVVISKSINIDKSITDEEYDLFSKMITAIIENFNKDICNCRKYTTGACSTSIGRSASGCNNICVKGLNDNLSFGMHTLMNDLTGNEK